MTANPLRPSSFLATKGLFPEHTFRAFQRWDLGADLDTNVKRVRKDNTVGGPSIGWLKDFGKVLHRRFGPGGPEQALVELAQRGCDLSIWRPLLLWHAVQTDRLLIAFLADWLFAEHQRGAVRVTAEGAEAFLKRQIAASGHRWSDSNITLSAGGLLRSAALFGLVTRGRTRNFAAFRLPDESFLYCVHDLWRRVESSAKVIAEPAWRIFLMTPGAVETELLRLHQLHRLGFSRAGSLVELKLPFSSPSEYARRMIA